MTKGMFYNQGDAAGYWAWLGRQEPAVARLAANYRPWEIYQMDDGRGLLVKIVGYDADETVGLLHVQYLNNPHGNGVITVTDGQIKLWGVGDLDTFPESKKVA